MDRKRITVDITPKKVSGEDALQRLRSSSVGKPYKNDEGELVGEIRKVSIENSRLIAEVVLKPGVILG